MKYREKSEVVEAIQWQPGMEIPGVEIKISYTAFIKNMSVKIEPGDYVVTENGKQFVRSKSVFDRVYEVVAE